MDLVIKLRLEFGSGWRVGWIVTLGVAVQCIRSMKFLTKIEIQKCVCFCLYVGFS